MTQCSNNQEHCGSSKSTRLHSVVFCRGKGIRHCGAVVVLAANGFACVRSRGTPNGDLLGVGGATFLLFNGAKTVKVATPPHNSGRDEDSLLVGVHSRAPLRIAVSSFTAPHSLLHISRMSPHSLQGPCRASGIRAGNSDKKSQDNAARSFSQPP